MNMTIPVPSKRSKRKLAADEHRRLVAERRREANAVRAQVNGRLREILNLMAMLPRAADAAEIVRILDRGGTKGGRGGGPVASRMPAAIQWMKDYENAWNEHGKGDAEKA